MNRVGINPSDGYVQPLGYMLSFLILQALAAETAIKASQVLKLGYFTHGHDLLELFDEMPYEMQQSINVVYQAFVPNGQIKDVLTEHRSDFEDWRYLYELKDGTSVNFLDLLVATEAMILNFDAISVDKSTSDGEWQNGKPHTWDCGMTNELLSGSLSALRSRHAFLAIQSYS